MYVLRPEFARHRLRYRAQPELGAGKGRIAAAAAQAGRGAGEKDVALAARQHQSRGFAAGQEARIAGHLPDLAEHPLGGVEDREVDVGADVEDADLERRFLVGIVEKCRDLGFLAGIKRPREDLAAAGLDLLHQRGELVAVAAAGKDRKTLGSEFLCDFGADKVPRTDDRRGRISLRHGSLPFSAARPSRRLLIQPAAVAGPILLSFAISRSLCLRILPVDAAGNASRNRISLGRL